MSRILVSGSSASGDPAPRHHRCTQQSHRAMPSCRYCAWLRPWFSVEIRRTSYCRTISPTLSVEPSSTTMTSNLGYSSRRSPSRHSRIVRLPLNVQTTTETSGKFLSDTKGACANACRTLSSAGFSCRSRVVRPKSQSLTSAPPRCHRSVHEKANAPTAPPAKMLSICHASVSACASTPLRRLSRPTSPITSGRSPVMF